MDELMDALNRYVRATIDYEKNYLNWSGPGPVTIKEKDDATEALKEALNAWHEDRTVRNLLQTIVDGVVKGLKDN